MAAGILGIAITGLSTAQAGIRTTEHNIANVNTQGYRRQEVQFTTNPAQYTGSGYIGSGVTVDTVRHLYNQFLDNSVLRDQGLLAFHDTYATQAGLADQLLGDEDSGLTVSLDNFFDAVNELANDPTSNMARQNFMSSGANLAGRFQSIDSQLRDMISSSNDAIATLVDQVNALAAQVASVNLSIQRDQAGSGGVSNDLVDQRDQLIGEINSLIGVTVLEQTDGTLNVFIGSGQTLVSGSRAYTLGTAVDASDTSLRNPTLDVGGSTLTLDADLITSGELGGLLAVREEVLLPALDTINRLALGVAIEVNAVHRNGIDYNLAAGGNFFSNPMVAQGATVGVFNVALVDDTAIDRLGYDITATAAGYDVTVLSTGVTTSYASLAAVNAAGLGISLSNGVPVPAVGESWRIGGYAQVMDMVLTSTSNVAAAATGASGPGDNTNALALADLRAASLMNADTASFAESYSVLIGSTASLAANADLSRSAYEALAEQSVAAQQSVSGVNLDEEAVNLIRFQQAYQAAAQALQIASSLFDEVLGLIR